MRKRIKRGIALLLSVIMVGSVVPLPTITIRAEESTGVENNTSMKDSTNIEVASKSALVVENVNPESTTLEGYVEEYFDLGEVETSAIPMSFFGLSDGKVSLINGTATNWIDRLDLTDVQVIEDLYNMLVEASDNDGTNDYLIEDSYFVLSTENKESSIKVAEITGTLDGTYSEADAKTKVSEVASKILANYSPYIRAAYDAFDRDHPEVFWLDGKTQAVCSSPYTMTETEQEGLYTVDYTVTVQFVLKSSEFDIRATGYQSQSAIEEAITTVNSKVSTLVNAVSDKTDREKVTYFNEQLTKTNEYNTSPDLSNIGHDCRECTSALTGSTGTTGPVCEAYARAFKVLCDEAGIPCVLVDGYAKNSANSTGEAHMWNYVQVDGKWLAVDVTWNDPKVSGTSGAVSGYESRDWLLVYADSEISDGMTFIESHPVKNQVSSSGVAFTNGPELAVYSSNTTSTREVATEAEFNSALADSSVDIIKLTQEITLSRSADGKDNVVVINRPVTITGGTLKLERAGIILGADVTFKDITLNFNTSVRNAIIANGYSLTINNVSSGGTYAIDLFCGGITDYNGGNASEILETGSNGSITMKGTNTIGGNIYAGSLSDIGHADEGGTVYPDSSNEYEGDATIILEKDATGFSNIYAHGARENRSGGYPNEWLPSAELYKVSGNVTIQLNSNKVVTVDGATGGTKNAMFIYTGDGSGNVYTPTLSNVDSIALLPSDSGTIAHLAPNTTQTSFTTLSVPENTRLSFVDMGDEISVSSLEGGGEIVLKEPSETSQKLTLSTASGVTKIAVGGIDSYGTGSTRIVSPNWTCITVTDTTSECKFSLMPNSSNANMTLEKDESGNWTTTLGECSASIKEITIEIEKVNINSLKEDNNGVEIPVTVSLENEDDFVSDIPMTVTVNGKQTFASTGAMGYQYFTGTTSSDIAICFTFDDHGKNILYITNYDTENDNYFIPKGEYEISITIPANNMADGQSETISFVLTVVCNEHTGGTATCIAQAICEDCEVAYGEKNLNNHKEFNLDNKCSDCGVERFTLAGYSVRLDGKIGLNFHMLLNDDSLKEDSYMKFTWNGEEVTISTESIQPVTVNGKTYYVFSCEVAAKEMADVITAKFYNSNNTCLMEKQYSVKEYAQVIIENKDRIEEYANAIPLVKAMLNYGAYAQQYFDYNESNLANNITDTNDDVLISDTEKDLSSITVDKFTSSKVSAMTIDGIGTFAGATLALESETTLNIYFTLADSVSIEDLTFSVDGNTISPKLSGEYYVIPITNIKANNIDKVFAISVTKGEETETFRCSVYAYCYSVLSDTKSQYKDELKNTLKALYYYNMAADAYIK